jgi:hypothetical protein
MDTNKLPELLLAWIGVMILVAVVRSRRKTPGAGLTLAYLLNLSLIHWVGASIYVLPAFQDQDSRWTELGFEQTLYGVMAFAFGALVITPLLTKRGLLQHPKRDRQPDSRLPKSYLACGVIFYLLLSTFLGRLPTATAIVSTGQQLIVAGLCLCCWRAWRDGNLRAFAGWLMLAFLMPLITVISQGFLGYGVVALLIVLIFLSSFIRSPFKVALVGVPLLYLGLTVFVSYMRDRSEIRASVWGGQSLSDRADKLAETAANFEWFDPSNHEQLMRVDARLNQNFLVGAAVARLSETDGYARGETLWDALLALVPRALWADKQVSAGSGTLVTRFTGIEFGSDTSVGIGQVLEFYGNFGTLGVVIGFLVMGTLITVLDWQAGECLSRSDLHGFVLWFLPGISLLQVGGQLVELTACAGASVIVAIGVNRYLDRLQTRQELECVVPQLSI